MLNGLLINYNFCTGCHSCEMACKVEHGFQEGEWGIKLTQQGPEQLPDGRGSSTSSPRPPTAATCARSAWTKAGFPPACTTARACAWSTGRWKSWRSG